MKWSWRIGSLFGFPVNIHLTFVLLLVLVYFAGATFIGAGGLYGVLFVVLVFASVVFHELSHALVARHYGIEVLDITLLPIGGVARMPSPPSVPMQEILISIAGPAASVLLGVVLWGIARLTASDPAQAGLFTGTGILVQLAAINIVLAIFNLIPAFPMDGGRVLRGLLALYLRPYTATRIAVGVGQVFAILLFFYGLLTPNYFLVLIALFVYLGAEAEERQMGIMVSLGNTTAGAAMVSQMTVLSPESPAGEAAERFAKGFQSDFPVVDDRRLVGLVTREALISTIRADGSETPVSQIMIRDFPTALEDTPLVTVLEKIEATGIRAVPILKGGELRGLITLEQIGRFNMMCSGYSCEFMDKDQRVGHAV